jgi:hypothetical protein
MNNQGYSSTANNQNVTSSSTTPVTYSYANNPATTFHSPQNYGTQQHHHHDIEPIPVCCNII